MNLIKNILGRIFALWAILFFVATLMVVIIPICLTYLFHERLGTEIFRRIANVWMTTYLTLIGCRLKIKGINEFVKGQHYIVASNHNSMVDIMVTTPFIPGPNKTIAKIEMSKIPVFGLIYKRGSVLVDRKSEVSRKESFNKMKDVVNAGMHMCIYPEGTRNKSNEPLKPFHDGAFKLSVDTGVPIMPTLLFNTRRVLPFNKTFYVWPGRIEMHFLPPVTPRSNQSVADLKEEVFKIMKDYFALNEPNLAWR